MATALNKLSPTEREMLHRFRLEAQKLPNLPEDNDEYCLRWLKARSFNYDNAMDMLKKHLIWRQEVGADQIFEWKPPEVLQKYFPGGFFGEDREGHPVYYDFYGYIDIKGMFRSAKKEDILKLKVYHGELTDKTLREYSEKKGRCISTITAVLNMEHLSYQRHYHWPSIVFIRELFQIFGDNYPERAKSVYIINAPRIFPMAYNVVKRFIEEDTRNKIFIMGDNWREELQRYISPDQLPQAYGGTRCEPDPQCSEYINWGGDIPESYYLTNNTETSRDDMEMIVIGRGSSHQIEVNVPLKGTMIRWEYLSVNFDIGFGLFYKPPQTTGKTRASEMMPVLNTRQLYCSKARLVWGSMLPDHIKDFDQKFPIKCFPIPSKRTDSHVVPENGYHMCSMEGTYVLRFDNTYSWTRTKEVMYTMRVLTPDPLMDQTYQEEFLPNDDNSGDNLTGACTLQKEESEALEKEGEERGVPEKEVEERGASEKGEKDTAVAIKKGGAIEKEEEFHDCTDDITEILKTASLES